MDQQANALSVVPPPVEPPPSTAPATVAYIRRVGEHVPALDALRGLAILLVMGFHFGQGGEDGSSLEKFISKVLGIGYHGVDLFFVLSGFLITGILLDTRDAPRYFRNFYIRRTLRIFPLYYGVLLVTLMVLPLVLPMGASPYHEAQKQQAWLWCYGSNIYHAWARRWDLAGFNHFWSLAVEEHFYLIWPLVIFFCRRRAALVVCVACVLFSLACRTGLALYGNQAALYALTPCRMDGLAIGGLLALAARRPQGIRALLPWAIVIAALSGLSILAIIWWNRSMSASGHNGMTIRFTLYALLFGAMLVFALTAAPASIPGRLWNSLLLRFFGKYSYGLCVFHYLLFPIFDQYLPAAELGSRLGSVLLGRAAFIALATGASLFLAFLSWHLYEKHFLKLKEVLAGRNKTGTGLLS